MSRAEAPGQVDLARSHSRTPAGLRAPSPAFPWLSALWGPLLSPSWFCGFSNGSGAGRGYIFPTHHLQRDPGWGAATASRHPRQPSLRPRVSWSKPQDSCTHQGHWSWEQQESLLAGVCQPRERRGRVGVGRELRRPQLPAWVSSSALGRLQGHEARPGMQAPEHRQVGTPSLQR